MRRALYTIALLLAAGIAPAQIPPMVKVNSRPAQIVQNLTGATPTSFSYITGITSGTTIGIMAPTITPSLPASTTTWTLSGTNAADFTINSSTGVITANSSTPTCTSVTPLTSINAVATDQKAYGSPFTQAITVTCELNNQPVIIQSIASSTNPGGIGITGNNFKMLLPNAIQAGDSPRPRSILSRRLNPFDHRQPWQHMARGMCDGDKLRPSRQPNLCRAE